MRIGIDISQIVYGTGVSVYTSELIKHLLLIDQENEYVLFGGSLRQRSNINNQILNFRNLNSDIKVRVFPFPPAMADLMWNRLHIINFERFVGRLDVYHSSDWAQAPSGAFKVTTVHDLSPIKYPKQTTKLIREVHDRRLKRVKNDVDRIIVPSHEIYNDLAEMGFKKHKIRVIHEAVDTKIFKKADSYEVEKIKRKFRIGEKYLLVVGSNARKNFDLTSRAFEQVRAEGLIGQLVATGRVSGNIKSDRGVIFTGFVKMDELVNLYSGASALVYVSNYEGFGLPILEAMACSCPVVTSNVSSMPEVAGGAAALVNPNKSSDIARGIRKVLLNKEIYVKKGKERVKSFSWEKTAKETLGVYKESV